ncbi:choice-of-anchor L domain-containing protein, partial [Flavobacterium ponti]
MKKITILLLLFSAYLGFSQGITVNPANTSTNSVQHIVEDILINSSCAQVSNFQTQGLCGVGSFGYTGSNFDFAGGMILRCGQVTNSAGQFTDSNISSICSSNSDAELLAISQANGNPGTINDVTFVKFNFTPLTDNFSFNFIFASNEYGTFQCGFSDVFAFILTDLTTGVSTNLAVIPGTTTPVSVTNIRDTAYNATCPSVNPTFFDTFNPSIPVASTVMNMRGYTVQMTAMANVIPNNPYSIKLAIGDYQDTAYDSAVFIEAGSFNVGTANLTYPVGVGIEDSDMTIANGLAPCPDEIRVLDTGLNPANYSFEWTFNDGSGPVILTSETGPTLAVSAPGTYCVRANNPGGAGCQQEDCIVVEYQPDFIINDSPNDLISCDNNFDLSENTSTILNGLDPFQYDLVFFDSLAEALDPDGIPISSSVTTTAPVTTFFVAVKDLFTNCVKITQFDAVVVPCQATMPPDLIVCDDASNDGVETFDLTIQDASVLGGLSSTDFTITYHLDQAGADAGNNFATPVTAYVGGPNQVIYVRMESNANPAQYSTTTFNLIVNLLPTATISANTTCEGLTGEVTITG